LSKPINELSKVRWIVSRACLNPRNDPTAATSQSLFHLHRLCFVAIGTSQKQSFGSQWSGIGWFTFVAESPLLALVSEDLCAPPNQVHRGRSSALSREGVGSDRLEKVGATGRGLNQLTLIRFLNCTAIILELKDNRWPYRRTVIRAT
jgi:hypothetical protein